MRLEGQSDLINDFGLIGFVFYVPKLKNDVILFLKGIV